MWSVNGGPFNLSNTRSCVECHLRKSAGFKEAVYVLMVLVLMLDYADIVLDLSSDACHLMVNAKFHEGRIVFTSHFTVI